MINLIPPQGVRTVKREYFLRTGATCLFLFSAVILFLAAAHIPTYVLVRAQINEIEQTSEKEADREESVVAAETHVKRVKAILSQLKKSSSSIREIDIVTEIEKHTHPSVELQNFTVLVEGSKTDMVHVRGMAKTREALAEFKSVLEQSPLFEKADVPISDLVRDTDLPFTITLTLTKT